MTIALTLCVGLAAAASHLGLAAIIGAFLAGMTAAEIRQRDTLEGQLKPIMVLIVSFFFVATGVNVNLGALSSASAIVTSLVVTLLAIAGKLLGCGLGALSLGRTSAVIVAMHHPR